MPAAPKHGSLAAALVAAQAEMPAVDKDGNNPHFKNKFTTLDHLIALTRPVLSRHGLAIQQFPSLSDVGAPTLLTRLTHESGQTEESQMPLYLAKQDMQSFGSAITYARRYAWAAALGIASEEDDDGNRASIAAPASAAAQASGRASSEAAAKPEQQRKLDRLIANLSNADGSKDWAAIANKYSIREFGHPRERLGAVEIEQVIANLDAYLQTLQVPA